MYQLQCQSGLGTAQAGPGCRDLPAVRGGSGGVSHAPDGTAPVAPTLAAKGSGHQAHSGDPSPHSVGKGGVRELPRPSVLTGNWDHFRLSFGSFWTITSPSAWVPDTKYRTSRRTFPSVPGSDPVIVPGREGKACLHPEKTGVWRLFLRKCFAPSHCLPAVFANECIKFEAKLQIIFCFIN